MLLRYETLTYILPKTMKILLLPNLYSIINIEGVELALDSHAEPYKTVMRF